MKSTDNHLDLVTEFKRRFPLLDKIAGLFSKDTPEERVPWFFGFFLAAAEQSGPQACCFVLDKKPGTTAIACVLAALIRFKKDFPELAKRYTRTRFSVGDRVKVKPDNLVYEYDGFWEDFDRLKLKVLDEQAWRGFPVEEILRLEPTLHFKPKGKGGPSFSTSEQSPLDRLLSLHSFGNKSLIKNTALILMEQTAFERFVDSTVLAPSQTPAEKFHKLSSFLPWGSIGQDGILKSKDSYQVEGEPLIAVTSAPEYLASACSNADTATKMVFVDGAKRIAGNLQAFDDIAERQRMVILASPDEREYIDQLGNRNCAIWKMSPEEILIGESSVDARARRSLVGATVKAADIRRRGKISAVDCEDALLQRVAMSLGRVMEMIKDEEESSEAERVAGNLRGILLDFSECCFGIGDGTMSNLADAKSYFTENKKYLEEEIKTGIQEALDGLEQAIENGYGRNKAGILHDMLSKRDGKWIVAARLTRTAECLREKLDPSNGFEVRRLAEIDPESEYDGVIVPAWPNRWNFAKLVSMALAPDIRVLTYPFEKELVLHHKKYEEQRSRSNRMDVEKRSSILGIKPSYFPGASGEETGEDETPRREMEIEVSSFFNFENRIRRRPRSQSIEIAEHKDARKAQAVYFFGECYALLTEWIQLPVLNEFVYKSGEEKPKLLQKNPSELSPGDFVLFRAGGDKEFIRLVAEEILGEEQYRKTRETAELWKRALRVLGDGPEAVRAELAKHGLNRSLATIGFWLRNPDLIAPQKHSDLEVIADAAGDTQLISKKDEVKQAIDTVRQAHRSAGRELTRLILSGLESGQLKELLDEQPVLQDFGYGEAWIVQVEFIESTLEMHPVGKVNRLLWLDEDE